MCEDYSAEVDLLAWAIDGAVGEGVDAGGGSGARLRGIETAMTIGDALIGAGEDIAAAACHQPTGSEGHGEGEGAVGCGGVCAQLLAVFVQQHNAGIGQGHTAAAIHDHEAQLVVARGYLKRTHTADVHQFQGLGMAVHRYAQCVDAFPVEGHGKGIAQLLPGSCDRVILRHIYGTAFESAANVLVVPVCLLAAFGHLLSRERGVVKLQAYLAIVFACQANAEAISGINQIGTGCKLHARILLGLNILLQGARLLFLFVEVVALVRQGKEQAVGSACFAIKVEETQIGMHVEREVAVFAGQLLEGLQFLIAAILGITAAEVDAVELYQIRGGPIAHLAIVFEGTGIGIAACADRNLRAVAHGAHNDVEDVVAVVAAVLADNKERQIVGGLGLAECVHITDGLAQVALAAADLGRVARFLDEQLAQRGAPEGMLDGAGLALGYLLHLLYGQGGTVGREDARELHPGGRTAQQLGIILFAEGALVNLSHKCEGLLRLVVFVDEAIYLLPLLVVRLGSQRQGQQSEEEEGNQTKFHILGDLIFGEEY